MELARGTDGHYLTMDGGVLACAMLGFTGLRPALNASGAVRYTATLPEGWASVEVGRVWVGGAAYALRAEHGQVAQLVRL